jgi:hypothetical protein
LFVGGLFFFLWGAFLNGTTLGPPADPEVDPFAEAADRGWRRIAPVVWRVGAIILVAVAFVLVTEVVV